jgi:ketosteroid isomerase-like protein
MGGDGRRAENLKFWEPECVAECAAEEVTAWDLAGTRADGSRIEAHGCDLFTFRNGKIALKNSYRKNRPPLASVVR